MKLKRFAEVGVDIEIYQNGERGWWWGDSLKGAVVWPWVLREGMLKASVLICKMETIDTCSVAYISLLPFCSGVWPLYHWQWAGIDAFCDL